MMVPHIKHTLKDSDLDCLCLIVGDLGTGKSTLCLYLQLLYDKQFTLDRMAWTSTGFIELSHEVPQYSGIALDEGIEAFFSRKAMSRDNVEQVKNLSQIRSDRNLFMVINTPDLGLMEKYLRIGRVNVILKCVMYLDSQTRKLRKGFVRVYDKHAIKNIHYTPKGIIEWPEPTFTDTFPNLKKTRPELWAEYLERSRKGKKQSRQASLDRVHGLKPKAEREKERSKEQWNKELSSFVWANRSKPLRKITNKWNKLHPKHQRSHQSIYNLKRKLVVGE